MPGTEAHSGQYRAGGRPNQPSGRREGAHVGSRAPFAPRERSQEIDGPGISADEYQVPLRAGEELGARGGEHDHLLDRDDAAPGDLEARLDREDHPLLKRLERLVRVLLPGRPEDDRAVVGEAPHLVAEGVRKLVVSLRDDVAPGDVVYLLAACASDIMLSDVEMALKIIDKDRVSRVFPGMPEVSSPDYFRCPR